MAKKMKGWILAIALAVLLSTFVACKDVTSEESSKDEIFTPSVTLNQTSMQLVVGDSDYLVAETYGIENTNVVFRSTDESVVTVSSDGAVNAINEGTADIIVVCGEVESKCTVTVSFNGLLPSLHSHSVVSGGEITISATDTFEFAPYVMFNGKSYTDLDLTYELSNPALGTMSADGIFTPAKLSATNERRTDVNVTGSWRGKSGISMQYTYSIKLISDVTLLVNDGKDIELYSMASFAGENFSMEAPFAVTAFENMSGGEASLAYDCTILQGEDLIELKDGKVFSKGKGGVAIVKVSCQDSFGDIHEQQITVNVLKPFAAYKETVEFSAMHGTLPVEEIFGKGAKLISALRDGKELTISEDGTSILGIVTTESDKTEEIVVTAYDEEKGYQITLNAYAGILSKAEDLSVFRLWQSSWNDVPTKNITGYYVLGNDIDASNYVFDTQGYIAASWTTESVGFNGTFDGRGYTIKNLTFGSVDNTIYTDDTRGYWNYTSFNLFGVIGTKGTVKNFALTNVQYNITYPNMNAAYCTGLATCIFAGATVENVYIDLACVKGGNAANTALWGVAYCIDNEAKMKNVMVDTLIDVMSQGTTNIVNRTPFVGRVAPGDTVDAYTATFKDVYLISDKTVDAYAGVKLYASSTAEGTSANDYSAFKTSGYWTVDTNSLPVWKGVQ